MNDLLLCVNAFVKTLTLEIVIWQATSKNCTKQRAARAARLFFLIQPIRSLFSGIVGNREFNWLNKMNKKKYSCYTCGTLFAAIF